jgi:hypothetical protein
MIDKRINSIFLERKERRDPPKFSDQLTDMTVFEGMYDTFTLFLLNYLVNQVLQLNSAVKLRANQHLRSNG